MWGCFLVTNTECVIIFGIARIIADLLFERFNWRKSTWMPIFMSRSHGEKSILHHEGQEEKVKISTIKFFSLIN